MPTARSYVTAGAALVGAGVITATPITTPNLGESTARWDVALAAATQSCAGDNPSALCAQVYCLAASHTESALDLSP